MNSNKFNSLKAEQDGRQPTLQKESTSREMWKRLLVTAAVTALSVTGLALPAQAETGELRQIMPTELQADINIRNSTVAINGKTADAQDMSNVQFPTGSAWAEHFDTAGVAAVSYNFKAFGDSGIGGTVAFPDDVRGEIKNAAFADNNITQLQLGGVERVGNRAFAQNDIHSINAPELIQAGNFSFATNSSLTEFTAPKLEYLGSSALQSTNSLATLELPSLREVGDGAFFGSTISELKSPNLEIIGAKAFASSGLKELHLNKYPQIANSAFDNSVGTQAYQGLFPIYIDGEDDDVIKAEDGVIVNPTENWRDAIADDFPEDATFLSLMPKGQEDTGFVTALDDEGNPYYCVAAHLHFKTGFFEKTEVEHAIYVIQHGNQQDPSGGSSPIDNIVSFDAVPADGNYRYGYETDLVSKLIYHSAALFEEREIANKSGATKIINLPTSLLELDSQVLLTHKNFVPYVTESEQYQLLVETFGEEFMSELFKRVENDNRAYTPASYMHYLGSLKQDVNEYGQPVIEPGQPGIDPGDPLTSISWEKVSSEDEEIFLAGSEWELTLLDESGEPQGEPISVIDCVANSQEECDGADNDPREGRFLVSKLQEGTYRLTETKAPEGYTLDASPLTIEAQGKDVEVVTVGKILNSPLPVDSPKPENPEKEPPATKEPHAPNESLPMTGGTPLYVPAIIALLAIALGGSLLGRRRGNS